MLPQAWAAIAGVGQPQRIAQALDSLDTRLIRRDLSLVALLDPPFDHCEPHPGYIRGYAPGVRENGGQYTHAAVWAAMGYAEVGDSKRAWEVFNLINPHGHANDPHAVARYKVEPYVVAADVYTNVEHPGRGGWTWYTGAAGWMYRLVLESLLGVHVEADIMRIAPLLPSEWPGFSLTYHYKSTRYEIEIVRSARGAQQTWVVCDAEEHASAQFFLKDDGLTHRVTVEVG